MKRNLNSFKLNNVTQNISYDFTDNFEQFLSEININNLRFLIFSFVYQYTIFFNKVELISIKELVFNGSLFQQNKFDRIISKLFLEIKSYFFKVLCCQFLIFYNDKANFLIIVIAISFLIFLIANNFEIIFFIFFIDDTS